MMRNSSDLAPMEWKRGESVLKKGMEADAAGNGRQRPRMQSTLQSTLARNALIEEHART